MIAMIRNRLHGTGLRIIMGFFLIIIGILWVMPQVPQVAQQLSNDWIIDINGNKISYYEFRRKYLVVDQQIQMIKQQYGQYADYVLQSRGISSDPQTIVLNELTAEELLNQVARRVPIDISSAYIKEKLKDRLFVQNSGLSQLLPSELIGQNGTIDKTALSYYLKHMNISAAQFEVKLEQALERFMVNELIGLSVHIPSFQMQDALKNKYARKKFSILTWSVEDKINQEKKTALTDAELQKRYDEIVEKYKKTWIPENRAGEAWYFDASSYGIQISDQEIERYYEKNKSAFVEQSIQIQVRRIVLKIQSDVHEEAQYALAKDIEQQLKTDSTQFAQLAKLYSDDTATASNGGLMNPFGKGSSLGKQFEQVAFMLKNDGDISNIFKSKDGFEIIQRIRKTPVIYKSLKSVEQGISKKLMAEAFKRQFTADVAQLTKKPNVNQLEVFAKKHKAVKQEAIPLMADGESAVARALFTLRMGEVTTIIDQDKGTLVQLGEIQKKHLADPKKYLPEFDKAKADIAQEIYTSRAMVAMPQEITKAKVQLKTESLGQIKKQYDLNLKNTGFIDLSDEKMATENLKSYGIPVEYFMVLEKVGTVMIYNDQNHSYLIRLDELEPLDIASHLGNKAAIKVNLYQEEIRRYVEGFVASLHRNATINLNESIITKLKDRA